jgi:hypothetical protein
VLSTLTTMKTWRSWVATVQKKKERKKELNILVKSFFLSSMNEYLLYLTPATLVKLLMFLQRFLLLMRTIMPYPTEQGKSLIHTFSFWFVANDKRTGTHTQKYNYIIVLFMWCHTPIKRWWDDGKMKSFSFCWWWFLVGCGTETHSDNVIYMLLLSKWQ